MILCAGEILVDKVVSSTTSVCHVGGAPFNVAVRASQAGADVRFVGCVGKDEMGDFLLQNALQYGVQLSLDVSEQYATTVALVSLDDKGERSFRFLRDNGADYHLDVARLDWTGVTTLHLGTLMLSAPCGRDFFASAVQEARKRGVRITLDANFRDDLFATQEERDRVMTPYLLMADVLKLGEDELASITHKDTVQAGVDALGYEGLLFVTLGAKGSAVYKGGKMLAQREGRKVARVVDTTGAGDAFFGTAIACLDLDADTSAARMSEILDRANLAGAKATQTEGAI